jgi:hypothetical protein
VAATGNAYGIRRADTCLAVDGPVALEQMLRTGEADRPANMVAFAAAALALLERALREAPA